MMEDVSRVRQAHEARREIEAALDVSGWPWSRGLSFWVDALLVIEEESGS
jgi:hypothetical protein